MSKKTTESKNYHALPNQERWINLNESEVKHLFVYYIILLIFSMLWLSFSVLYHYELGSKGFSNILGVFMFAFPAGVAGATIYYIRKLYKSCIQNLVYPISDTQDIDARIRKIGTKMYFYLRPVISGILALLIDMGIIAGFCFINNQPDIDNNKFFLFVIIVSFYVGFGNGKIILNMEKKSEDVVGFIFKGKENINGEKGQ